MSAAAVPQPPLSSKLLFFALGIATLIPWNSVLTTLTNFDCKLQSLHIRVDTAVTFTFTVFVTVGTLTSTVIGDRLSFRTRMIVSFSSFFVVMIAIWLFAQLEDKKLAYGLVLVCAMLLGLGDAMSESTLYALSPLYWQRQCRQFYAAQSIAHRVSEHEEDADGRARMAPSDA